MDILAIAKTVSDEGGLLVRPVFEGMDIADEVVADLAINPSALVYFPIFGERAHAFNITSVEKVRDEWVVTTPSLKLIITNLWLPEHLRHVSSWKSSPERPAQLDKELAELLQAMSAPPESSP